MTAVIRLLVYSGISKPRAVLAVLGALLCFNSAHRRLRMEQLVARRKEVWEVKDLIVEFVRSYIKEGDRSVDHVSRSLLEDRFREDHSIVAIHAAFAELIADAYLKLVPANMPEPVYTTTAKRYMSKTGHLAAMLSRMGVYARVIKEQRPYQEPREFKL